MCIIFRDTLSASRRDTKDRLCEYRAAQLKVVCCLFSESLGGVRLALVEAVESAVLAQGITLEGVAM